MIANMIRLERDPAPGGIGLYLKELASSWAKYEASRAASPFVGGSSEWCYRSEPVSFAVVERIVPHASVKNQGPSGMNASAEISNAPCGRSFRVWWNVPSNRVGKPGRGLVP